MSGAARVPGTARFRSLFSPAVSTTSRHRAWLSPHGGSPGSGAGTRRSAWTPSRPTARPGATRRWSSRRRARARRSSASRSSAGSARPRVVLCPTRTIQRQWGEKQALFGPSSADLHVLTYQSLCQTTDPEGMLRDAAHRIWLEERAAATGQTRRRGRGRDRRLGRAGGTPARARRRAGRRARQASGRGGQAARHPRPPAALRQRDGARAGAARRRGARRRPRRMPSPAVAVGRAAEGGLRAALARSTCSA